MTLNRREFLWQAGALTAGVMLAPQLVQAATKPRIGLQLYTCRQLLDQDLNGTLKQIASIGYKELESASGAKGHYYGMKPKELSNMVADMGMKLRAHHVTAGRIPQAGQPVQTDPTRMTLFDGLQQHVDMAAEAGLSYLVCSSSNFSNLDELKRVIELFNRAGEACKKAGMTFAFHNHDREFKPMEGQIPYELMLSQTDKDLVKFELDLFWILKAGTDPVDMFKKNPGRYALWHVKDMDNTENKNFTEIGNGTIDFKPIFAAAKTSGMKYFFVEQDRTPGNPLDSIAISYKNLSKVLA
ncbi:sugar phosphate isomerase/epimerase family protein [Adhaeribacter aquaticus]|uniref:sugar phosphate isomerase/epimerase family protein n=1 Tax=Adhaeribacter aquaticus TaxID=299567 RepID=UPI000410242B|nr:sugar phosphate isomerase/epimerase [Adhaeribacter aquaticus]